MRLLTASASDLSGRRLTTQRRIWPPAHPAQLRLLLASVVVILGSFLPWVVTGFGTYRGIAGPGLWTFYAGVFGIAGALIPMRRLAVLHGAALTLAALFLPMWQVQRIVTPIGYEGWTPGFGLGVVVLAGLVGGSATLSIWRDR